MRLCSLPRAGLLLALTSALAATTVTTPARLEAMAQNMVDLASSEEQRHPGRRTGRA